MFLRSLTYLPVTILFDFKTVAINSLMLHETPFRTLVTFVTSCRTLESAGTALLVKNHCFRCSWDGLLTSWFNVLIYNACINQCCCRIYKKTKLQVRNVTAIHLKQTLARLHRVCSWASRRINLSVCSTENVVGFWCFFCCFIKTADDKEKRTAGTLSINNWNKSVYYTEWTEYPQQ